MDAHLGILTETLLPGGNQRGKRGPAEHSTTGPEVTPVACTEATPAFSLAPCSGPGPAAPALLPAPTSLPTSGTLAHDPVLPLPTLLRRAHPHVDRLRHQVAQQAGQQHEVITQRGQRLRVQLGVAVGAGGPLRRGRGQGGGARGGGGVRVAPGPGEKQR